MESVHTIFDVDTWTDSEIVTKRDAQPCTSRTLTLDIANKQAQSVTIANTTNKSCKPAPTDEQSFKLVAGMAMQARANNSK